MRHARSNGFVGIICIGLIAVALTAALLPAASRMREMENRINCAKNLRMIGQAIAMYCNNETRNGNAFPRTVFKLDDVDHPKAFTAWNQPHSFGEGAPSPNDITAAFYLLFKTSDQLKPETLVCPDSGHKALSFADQTPKPANPLAATRTALSNFPGIDYISYSIQNMYPARNALAAGWKWNAAISPEVALVADLNPGGKAVSTVKPTSPTAETAQANSPNHGRAGQNVLYGDFHVEWQVTPFCGAELEDKTRDNIYCRRAGVAGDPVMGPSEDRFDSVLLPAADYKPAEK